MSRTPSTWSDGVHWPMNAPVVPLKRPTALALSPGIPAFCVYRFPSGPNVSIVKPSPGTPCTEAPR